jgi:hypothetical protein
MQTVRRNQGPLSYSTSARTKTLFLGISNRREFPEYAGEAGGEVVGASVLSLDHSQVATTHQYVYMCVKVCVNNCKSSHVIRSEPGAEGTIFNGSQALESWPDLRLPLHCVQVPSELDQHIEDTHTDHEDGNGESYFDDETPEEWANWGYSSLQY